MSRPIFLSQTTLDTEPYFESPTCAEMVVSAIHHGREQGWYYLIAFAVLPDEMQMVVVPRKQPLDKIIPALRDHSTPLLSIVLFGETDIWDPRSVRRPITNPRMLQMQIEQVHLTPVMQGLSRSPTEYPFSSANERFSDMIDY